MSSILIVISITHSGLFLNNLYDTKLIVMRTIILTFAWLSLSVSALSQNLVAYYPFNGNANDESGNSINPTYTGAGVTLTTDRFGNANKAYHFDGAVNSYMRMPADMMPTTNRTISLWFNVPDVTNRPGLLGYGGNGSCGTTLLMGINLLGSGQFHVQGHCGNNAAGYTYLAAPVNNWYHWVLTINGSTQKIYVNGQLKSTDNTFSGSTAVSGKDFSLGVITSISGIAPFTDVNVGYLTGKLDDVRIYDAAMTDAQVLQLYNNETTGLVAYFPFNGNANDESGNANHGTVDGATLTTDRFNNTNKAYAFNGSSNYINVPDAAILRPQLEITLSAWVKRTRFGIDIITEKGGDWTSGTCNYGMGLHSINNNMFYFFFNGGWRGTDGFNDFNWHYYTVVAKNGDSNPVLYIDGVQKVVLYTSGAGTISMNNSALDLHIGAQISGGYYGANLIDELKIYNRQLSASEVQQNYNQSATGLVAYYPFTGNANDESGNNINLTNSGSTLVNDRFGNLNSAYYFDGTAKMYCSDNDLLDLTKDFTISFWIKRSSSILYQFVMSKHLAGENGIGSWGIASYSGTDLSLEGTPFWGSGSPNPTSTTIPVNQWSQIAYTFNKVTNDWKCYFNGTLSSSGTMAFNIQNTTKDFMIGTSMGYSTYFTGSLDDIRIYNRVLSPNEIAKLADKPMMPDLIAYLPMNGDANDKSGNNRNGSPYGGAALTTDKYDNANSAYYFTNPECGISLANSTALDFTGQPFAISAWVKYSNIPAADFAVVSKHNCGTPNGYLLGINNNSPRFYLCSGGSWSIISTTETYNDNKWHHLVATYDGTGSQQLYVDGELKASASSVVFNTSGSGAPVIIGDANNNCSGATFSASIDEVKIYGAALDAAQVSVLYKQSRGSGNAIRMHGNGYFDIGNLGAPHFFTIEAWIKRINTASTQYILSGNSANSWSFGVTSNRLFVSLNGASTVTSGDVPEINDGKWHHVAVAFQDGPMNFYVDGVHKGWVEITTSGLAASNYSIGTQFSPGNSFDGEIDEIRIWDWVLDADNPDTIRSWMNRKITPAHPVYTNLVRYYTFNETNLNKTYDIAGASTGLLINNIGSVSSGAAIGDVSVSNFSNPMTHLTTLALGSGEQFSLSEPVNHVIGANIYAVKDPPEVQTGILGLGSNDHYFGIHISTDVSSPPLYTATYNYTGNPFVSSATEPTLQLFKRNDNSAANWANSGAVLNTTANILTVTGQNTEYILGSSGFALPVTMISFEARKLNASTAQLTWKTATEFNNKGFEVQRSFDGNYFTVISFVNSAGNSDVLKEYRITDVPGRTGRVYYRLKQVDLNGNGKLSNIVSVLFSQEEIIKIYPNPAQRQVTIEGADQYNRVQLLDAAGKLVKEQLNSGQHLLTMNLDGLRSGMYLLRLINGNDNSTIKLMIVN